MKYSVIKKQLIKETDRLLTEYYKINQEAHETRINILALNAFDKSLSYSSNLDQNTEINRIIKYPVMIDRQTKGISKIQFDDNDINIDNLHNPLKENFYKLLNINTLYLLQSSLNIKKEINYSSKSFDASFLFKPLSSENNSEYYYPIDVYIKIKNNTVTSESLNEEFKSIIYNYISNEKLPDITFDFDKISSNIPSNELFHSNILPNFSTRYKKIDLIEHYKNDILNIPYNQQRMILKGVIHNDTNIETTANFDSIIIGSSMASNIEGLSSLVSKTFGPKGLKVFTGILVELGKSVYSNSFIFEIDSFLKTLGYKKDTSGSYNIKLKKDIFDTLRIFLAADLLIVKKNDKKVNLSLGKILTVDKIDIEIDKKEDGKYDIKDIIEASYNAKYKITAGSTWYPENFKYASTDNSQSSIQYAKILQSLACEDIDKHAISLFLTHYLTAQWRMSFKEISRKVITILNLCTPESKDSKELNSNKLKWLKILENELNYMNNNCYLGDWKIKETNHRKIPSCKSSFDLTLILYPPNWFLKNTLNEIKTTSYQLALPNKKLKDNIKLDINSITNILKLSGLSKRQFASSIGISPPFLTNILKGNKKISNKVNDNIIKIFGHLID